MDYEGFRAACAEQWAGFDDPDTLLDRPHPKDRRLAHLPDQVRGFATENKLMLLNLAVRHLEPGEVYVEVGSWQGLSLIGAAVGNEERTIFACDDFSKMGATEERLHENLRAHCPDCRIQVVSADFRDFLDQAPWRPARVGAYFYDGSHTFDHQFKALELVRPWLGEDAVVVIDDTRDGPVRAANKLFRRHVPAFEMTVDLCPRAYPHPNWWNGIQVFRYHADGAPARLPVSRPAYLARRMMWNRLVVYGQRLSGFAWSAAERLRERANGAAAPVGHGPVEEAPTGTEG